MRIGRSATEQDAAESPWASPSAIPRTLRRLELACDCHEGGQWTLLAVLGPEHFVTELFAEPYPGAETATVEINCMECRTRWQLSMGALRRRADAGTGLEVVGMSTIAQVLPLAGLTPPM
jgi:hypothetical protein